MPETPAPGPEGRRVHFTPPAITPGDARETRPLTQQSGPLRHYHGHQSDFQPDDPFVGPRGNAMAEAYPQVFVYIFFK
jgi:hypothetical protein